MAILYRLIVLWLTNYHFAHPYCVPHFLSISGVPQEMEHCIGSDTARNKFNLYGKNRELSKGNMLIEMTNEEIAKLRIFITLLARIYG